MLRRVRIKFIMLSMSALFVLLAFIIAGINLVNYSVIINDADIILEIMSENEGTLPALEGEEMPGFVSRETPYETRYFSVVVDDEKKIIEEDISRIAAVDRQTAREYAVGILGSQAGKGDIGEYRYIRQLEGGFHRITFWIWGDRYMHFGCF